ncbi:MAG: hypothetical protein ACOYXR_04280 [Nitrospirota bacterium]
MNVVHSSGWIDLDMTLAVAAAKVGLQNKLPLADSVGLATARAHHAVVWTQDANSDDLEGVRFKKKRG